MIGRAEDNFIQLSDPKVSKHHAEIRPDGNGWQIRDSGSRNGIFVNGVRVEQSPLKDGDRIMMGSHVLVFETSVDGNWKPLHVIDFSTQAGQRTLAES